MLQLKKIGFFCAFILPVLVVVGFQLGGWWNFLCAGFTYIMIPILDVLVGKDSENVEESKISAVAEEYYYRFITYAWVYVQLTMVVWGAYSFAVNELGVVASLGFLLGMANVTGGIGITVAHELGHRNTQLEQFYAKVLLMTVSYMHFFIEHNRGHHVHVATRRDPATSRKGENFYTFWLRTVVGSYRSAWQIECNRLIKKGLPVWSWHNEMIRFAVFPVLFCGMLTLGLSLFAEVIWWKVPVFFVLQSVMAFSLLELVNYIEHYGILRREIAPQKYERVNPLHSWNANQLLTNFFLFQLQRHSDHHANANLRYQVLRHMDESPQLPFGYPTMIMIALVPPLWFKLMDNRLEDWKRQSINVA